MDTLTLSDTFNSSSLAKTVRQQHFLGGQNVERFAFGTAGGKCRGVRNTSLHIVRLVAQLCPTRCDPMDCSPPGSSVHGDSPSKNTGVSNHTLLQGIFLTQGLNPNLLYCRQILYLLRHHCTYHCLILSYLWICLLR